MVIAVEREALWGIKTFTLFFCWTEFNFSPPVKGKRVEKKKEEKKGRKKERKATFSNQKRVLVQRKMSSFGDNIFFFQFLFCLFLFLILLVLLRERRKREREVREQTAIN